MEALEEPPILDNNVQPLARHVQAPAETRQWPIGPFGGGAPRAHRAK
jgi:hypothetical protein